MKILSIETSCDETAVSLVEATGSLTDPAFAILGNSLFSQIAHHTPFGGVVPTLAKREHGRNLPHLLIKTLTEGGSYTKSTSSATSSEVWTTIETILSREEGLYVGLREALDGREKPDIDCIAVTAGPGLEPALWVGISCALALGKLWGVPVVPVNHMEGHIVSVLLTADKSVIQFPAVALLISGGHTELVSVANWGQYEILGQTRDDAVGEAFDKVARLLGLPYPGGPEISRLAEAARKVTLPHVALLPRPMIHSHDLNFSFSGLKTAVLYYIRDYLAAHPEKEGVLNETDKEDLSREFEDAVTEVLTKKTKAAIEETGARTLIVAGGVISNRKLRETFTALADEFPGLTVQIPTTGMATDNAVMIAFAAYLQTLLHPELLTQEQIKIIAQGNLKL